MRDERTYKIIGAAMEVHKELGCGFLEGVYQEALGREFGIQEIPFKSQPTVQISYKGHPLGKTYQPDFICYEEIIVEIKAVSSLSGVEEAQLINYLKATGLKVGLLINFGARSLEYKRMVYGSNPQITQITQKE
jgi:GxxExxY protein